VPEYVRTIRREVTDRGPGGHILTGPVYVNGAMPGDVLDLRILEIDFAVPYGFNAQRPYTGAARDDSDTPAAGAQGKFGRTGGATSAVVSIAAPIAVISRQEIGDGDGAIIRRGCPGGCGRSPCRGVRGRHRWCAPLAATPPLTWGALAREASLCRAG
jgi:hypothetical protein